jgi:hypothetical protein
MSLIKSNIWNSFDEYQEYQLSGNIITSNISSKEKNDEYDCESEEEELEESFYSSEIKEEKEFKKSNISYVSSLPSDEIIDIIKNVPNSFFNSFGRIVFDKPSYLSETTPTNASLFDNLTVSYIEHQINNEYEHKQYTRKELIEDVFNTIKNIISQDARFKILIQNTFYEMEVSYIEVNSYDEKFKISLYIDNENNNNIIIEMKGIKRDNVCNLFFFYNINKALGNFYDIKSYKNQIEVIGINYLPNILKRNIYLHFV